MAVDFGKIFDCALRYPLKLETYLLLFIVQLVFSLINWFLLGYSFAGITTETASSIILGKFLASLIYLVPLMIINILVMIFLSCVYFENSLHFYKGKRKPLPKSFVIAKKRFLPLLATVVVMALIFALCFGGIVLILFSLSSSIQGSVSAAGTALLVIGGIWLLVGSIAGLVIAFFMFLAPVICVLDETGPYDSIKKSFEIIGKNKLNTLVFLIIFAVIFLILSIVGALPETVSSLLTGIQAETYQAFSIENISFFVFRAIFSAYSMLFAYSSLVNYYLSIRKRKPKII